MPRFPRRALRRALVVVWYGGLLLAAHTWFVDAADFERPFLRVHLLLAMLAGAAGWEVLEATRGTPRAVGGRVWLAIAWVGGLLLTILVGAAPRGAPSWLEFLGLSWGVLLLAAWAALIAAVLGALRRRRRRAV